jgi:uncharacterized protein (TIGR03437 family)
MVLMSLRGLLLPCLLLAGCSAHRVALTTAPTPASGDEESSSGEAARKWMEELHSYPYGRFPSDARVRAVRAMEAMRPLPRALGALVSPITTPWKSIGPTNLVNDNIYGSPFTSGRVNALAADPTDPKTMYLGADQGGVWKTADAGVTWAPLTDDQPVIDIRALAVAPGNRNYVYAATGANYAGVGTMSSADAGASWTYRAFPAEAAAPPPGVIIRSLAVSPANPASVFAAVEDYWTVSKSGIYRSDDAGANWRKIFGNNLAATSVFFDAANSSVMYAVAVASSGTSPNSGVYKTTDGGQTWLLSNGAAGQTLPVTSGTQALRLYLAQAPSDPSTLYAVVMAGSGALGAYRTTDAAQTWTAVSGNIPSGYCGDPTCAAIEAIAVHPKNPNVVFAAGTHMARSTDGGASWADVNKGPNAVVSHVDHHAAAFSSDGATAYLGNDGGVWSSTDSDSLAPNWKTLTQTLNVTEFYPGLALHPTDPNVALGGTQDNSFIYWSANVWKSVWTGDFMWSQIDPSNPSVAYSVGYLSGQGSYVRTTNAFRNFSVVTFEKNSKDTRFPWVTPFVLDPVNSQRMYIGTYKIYQTLDGGSTWNIISPDLTGGSGAVTAVEVSAAKPEVVYAAVTTSRNRSAFFVNTAALTDGSTWQERSTGLPPRQITRIVTNPANANEVFVTVAGYTVYDTQKPGHVFHSTDGGQTWQDISTNLPDIPALDLALDPDQPGTLYLGTSIGVFTASDVGGQWQAMGTGLPRAAVNSIRLHRGARLLRVATYGRGMWDLPVPAGVVGPAAPAIASGGVVDPWTYSQGVAPGGWVALFGTGLATQTAIWNPQAGGALPTTLGGVQVLIDGVPAVLNYVSPGLVNILVPLSTAPGSATVAVVRDGVPYPAPALQINQASPAIYSLGVANSAPAKFYITAVAPLTGELVGNPTLDSRTKRGARAGETIDLYCIGLGATSPLPPANTNFAGAYPLVEMPGVKLGAVTVQPMFAGLTTPGLYLVRIVVPPGTASGEVAVSLVTSAGTSRDNVILRIQ